MECFNEIKKNNFFDSMYNNKSKYNYIYINLKEIIFLKV
jgi:hypothetical protein